jgi:hypothetical protein
MLHSPPNSNPLSLETMLPTFLNPSSQYTTLVYSQPKVISFPYPVRLKFKYHHQHIAFILNDVLLFNPFVRSHDRPISHVWLAITARFNEAFACDLNSSRLIAMVSLWLKRYQHGEKIPVEGDSNPEMMSVLEVLITRVILLREEARSKHPARMTRHLVLKESNEPSTLAISLCSSSQASPGTLSESTFSAGKSISDITADRQTLSTENSFPSRHGISIADLINW